MGQNGSAMRLRPDVPEDEYVLTLRPEPQYVGTARAFAAAIARHFRCDEERVQDIKVAISEACSNAIKAHRAADVSEPVKLVVTWHSGRLWYEVEDSGRGFDVSPAGDVPPADEGDLFEGGIGLMLIRSLFPDVEISRNAVGGMSVRIPIGLDAPSTT